MEVYEEFPPRFHQGIGYQTLFFQLTIKINLFTPLSNLANWLYLLIKCCRSHCQGIPCKLQLFVSFTNHMPNKDSPRILYYHTLWKKMVSMLNQFCKWSIVDHFWTPLDSSPHLHIDTVRAFLVSFFFLSLSSFPPPLRQVHRRSPPPEPPSILWLSAATHSCLMQYNSYYYWNTFLMTNLNTYQYYPIRKKVRHIYKSHLTMI